MHAATRESQMKKKSNAQIEIRPLTPDLWPAFEDLFDTKGPCSRCWCMYWRIGAALQAAKAAQAPALEAYPLDAEKTPSASSTGYATTFARAGFKTIAYPTHHVPQPEKHRHRQPRQDGRDRRGIGWPGLNGTAAFERAYTW